jgi:hypothetical protein
MNNYKNLLFAVALNFIVFSTQAPYAMADSNTAWNTFKAHSTIIGFTLGESTIEEIINKMSGEMPNIPEDKHELAKVCFKLNDESHFITFSTGVLHDYSTLYGFIVSTDIPDNFKGGCKKYRLVDNETIGTVGGLYIGQHKDEVLTLLGNSSKKTSQNWIWNYEHYLSYDEPKISSSVAGPTGSKYMMKNISKGAYEDGTISIKFINDKIAEFAVNYFAESDFEIEHYDINTGERIR